MNTSIRSLISPCEACEMQSFESKSAATVTPFPANRPGAGNPRAGLRETAEALATVLANWYHVRDNDGSPKTLAELARMLGLPVWKLLRARESPEFTNAMRTKLKSIATESFIPITYALIHRAKQGSAPHMRLFFEYAAQFGLLGLPPRSK